MKKMMKILAAFGLASAMLILPPAPARAGIEYNLIDLGTLGGTGLFGTQGYDVNDSGQVVGTSYVAGNITRHAFLSGANGGALKDLGTLLGSGSIGLSTFNYPQFPVVRTGFPR